MQNDPFSGVEDLLDSDYNPLDSRPGDIWNEETACYGKFDLKFEEVRQYRIVLKGHKSSLVTCLAEKMQNTTMLRGSQASSSLFHPRPSNNDLLCILIEGRSNLHLLQITA